MERRTSHQVDFDVIIVGGGIAGITAARHLLSNEVENILVLEAQDYLGGRIKTINTEYGHIDLGAEWIHGQTGNPLYKMAEDHNLTYKRGQSDYISPSSASIYDVHEFRTETGDLIDRKTVCDVSRVMEDLYDMQTFEAPTESQNAEYSLEDAIRMNEESCSSKKAVLKSMAEHFEDGFSTYLETIKSKSSDKEIKHSLYKWRLKWELGDNCCSSLEDVAFPGRYLVYEGQGITDLKEGFRSIFNLVEKDVPKHCIRLCTPVRQIKWNQNYCVVECNNGSVLNANHVIVTVPIGYLQKHHKTLFSPPLPRTKVEAIHNVGFSSLIKIFLVWSTPFWEDSFNGVQFVWTTSIVPEAVQNRIEKQDLIPNKKSNGNPWYYDITGFERVAGRPNMLCGWLVGEGATLAKDLSDSDVVKTCTNLLQLFCGDFSIPEPNYIHKSNWGSNKYIGGGYSYVSTRTTDEDFGSLCESLPSNQNPRVIFAGEATSFNYYSTAHGAYQSGIRSAQDVLNTK